MNTKMLKWFVRVFAAIGYVLMLLQMCSSDAQAHDVPASNVLLDIGAYAVEAEIELPLNELREAIAVPADTNALQIVSRYHTQLSAYMYSHIDVESHGGERYAKRVALLEVSHIRDGEWIRVHIDFAAPADVSTNIFVLKYDAIIAQIVTHNAVISVRRDFRNGLFSNAWMSSNETQDNGAQIIGLMHYQQKQLTVDGSSGSWVQGFRKIFLLGMQHIAEGIDHVLFLFVLLLSAPLKVHHRRWQEALGVKASAWKVLKTVSGFTLGHSVTLILGAIGVVKFPSDIVEVLIAFSILVSAAHAVRPLFANKEHYIAAVFGLIHGMAFAGSLSGFDYDSLALTLAILGFNLGIEAEQLIIVALVLPSLLLMRVLPLYRYFRVIAAILAGMLAIAWIIERAFAAENPLSSLIDALTAHGGLAIALFAVLAIVSRSVDIVRWWRTPFAVNRRSRINLPDPFNP